MKVKRSMLEYCKIILSKMTFSQTLFRKEYKKSIGWLPEPEVKLLNEWVRTNYGKPLADHVRRDDQPKR